MILMIGVGEEVEIEMLVMKQGSWFQKDKNVLKAARLQDCKGIV